MLFCKLKEALGKVCNQYYGIIIIIYYYCVCKLAAKSISTVVFMQLCIVYLPYPVHSARHKYAFRHTVPHKANEMNESCMAKSFTMLWKIVEKIFRLHSAVNSTWSTSHSNHAICWPSWVLSIPQIWAQIEEIQSRAELKKGLQ